ncbi:MAG: cache domain-containing protein [Desulfobacterales bacterium]
MTASDIVCRCTGCGKSYKVDVSQVKGSTCRFTCKECQTVNTVERPEQTETPVVGSPKVEGLSIRSKITVIFVALVLASLSAVGFVATYKSRSALLEQSEAQLRQVTAQKAKQYGLVFERLQHEAESIAKYSAEIYETQDYAVNNFPLLMPWTGSQYGDPAVNQRFESEARLLERIGPMIRSVVTSNPNLELGYMATENDVFVLDDVAARDAISKREGFVPSRRPWYVKAKEMHTTAWTDPYVDANTGKLIITCATPVLLSNQSMIGVVGLDVLLDTIQKDILSLDIGYDSYAMLIDNKGKALVRPGMNQKDTRWDETYRTEDLLNTDNAEFNGIVARMTQGKNNVEQYASNEGDKLIAYAPLPTIDASLAIVASKNEVIRPAVAIQYFIAGVWGIVLIIAVIIGFALGNGITKPINKLTTMADLISQGKLDLDVMPEERKDEIGLLTRSFNRLVISLKMAMAR